ncbi:hypothetical protein CEUSTIGMA_g748.t1 [Chlamydomonas eustigma]|uniref:Nucleotide-diphospho-sugar transferase domain-containing protein n=1 Tax=Chlamydomonas eustigma TaxID=1157962 RepID=A0A250WR09_9CHLO|nr:hypothetical protein CEUSTIGMA_g748.t1 [Chlamydomonas eustigma]|eukprot:GAX73294.1 hypothetical protein CEUSTIGMA_g748.t1 [Chlamydomonas eustigma]
METTNLDCAQSGYCSLGKVQPWTGDVWPSVGLKASVAARSFKKELIVIGESRTNPFMQAYLEFRHLGIGHIMWITNRQEKCEHAEMIFPKELGCGWSTQVYPQHGLVQMHMHRVAYLARSLRLGVNVFLVDTDIFMFRDPYRYLKSPPLKDLNMIIMRDGDGWANCGVVYVQNAAPNGASAYIVGDILERLLRWTEDSSVLQRKEREPPFYQSVGAGCWDQSVYSDTMLSAVSGRPLFFHCWNPGGKHALAWRDAHAQILNVTGDLGAAPYMNQVATSIPTDLLELKRREAKEDPRVGVTDHATLLRARISVPRSLGAWPLELGGPPFADRKNASSQWRQALLADEPSLWPDPYQNITSQDSPAAVSYEDFAFFPLWFVQTWSMNGWSGFWSKPLVDGLMGAVSGGGSNIQPQKSNSTVTLVAHPQQWNISAVVSPMAHFVHCPGGPINKLSVKMANGRYNWTAAHISKAGVGAFFMSTPQVQAPERVVAYSDDVVSVQWRNETEFLKAIRSLVRVALLSNRTAAFPYLNATLGWVSPNFIKHKLPIYNSDHRFIIYAKSWDDVRAMWVPYLQQECLQRGSLVTHWQGGLLPVEYEHYMELLLERSFARGAASWGGGTEVSVAASAMSVPSVYLVDIAGKSRSTEAVPKEAVVEGGKRVLPKSVHMTASEVIGLMKGSTSRVAILNEMILEASNGAGSDTSTAEDRAADSQVEAAMNLFATKNCFTLPQ